MPSSVMLGSRPRMCFTRAYSSALRPCSAAISGVTLISVLAVAISKFSAALSCGLGGADERLDHGAENHQAVGGAEGDFRSALRMRHEAGDVALAAADSGNVAHGAVGIACGIG